VYPASIVPTIPEGTPRAFRFRVPEQDLDGLQRRLASTRLPDDPHNDEGAPGFPTAFLRELVSHRQHVHDGRATEARLNALDQYAVTIDGRIITRSRHEGRARIRFP
jgi:epoxide hydrolase